MGESLGEISRGDSSERYVSAGKDEIPGLPLIL